MITRNRCLTTDSYKPTHWPVYPSDTRLIQSYFESRGGMFKSVLWFGLQMILMENFVQPTTREEVEEADLFYTAHLGPGLFNKAGWLRIVGELDGKFPISIRAVPEGTSVPTGNVLMVVENTHPAFPWATNWAETLLCQVWYPTTVATLSRECKRTILRYTKETGGDPAGVDFKLHDFGFRGVSSLESAALGGCAHLVNFKGSDTIPGILAASQFYREPMAAFSIPASEHSVITSYGREGEVEAYRAMVHTFGHNPFYACVSDSWDIFNACKLWGTVLKDEVLAAKGTLVVRPDSGNPQEVVPKVLDILGEHFGATINREGYKVLHPKVRVIQGDGCNYQSIDDILGTMKFRGWAAENVAFGMGGGLLQQVNRDTQQFAFKCSYMETDKGGRDVFKEPVTQPNKRSKRGQLKLIRTANGLQTVNREAAGDDLLVDVYRDGEIIRLDTFAEIRQRAAL